MGACNHPAAIKVNGQWVCTECGEVIRTVEPWER